MAATPLLILAFRGLGDDELKGLIEDLVRRSGELIDRELRRTLIGQIETCQGDDEERLSRLTEEFREASIAYGSALRGLIAWANARERRIDLNPKGRPRGYRKKTR